MKKLWVTILLVAIVSLLFTFIATKRAVIRKDYKVEDGVLNLSNTDISTGQFPLAGKWEFYWHQLLRPGEYPVFAPSYISVPTLWNDIDLNGRPLSSNGYATYKLTVILPPQHPEMGLEIPDVYSSHSFYLNDSLVAQNGRPGINKESTTPFWNTKFIKVPANKDTLVLLMQVANYWHSKGGTYRAPVLGSYAQFKSHVDFNWGLDILVAGCFLMCGLFSFALYLFSRTNISILFFSLFCAAYFYRVIGGEPYILHQFWPSLSWFVTIRLEYVSLALYVAFFVQYIRSLYPEESTAIIINVLFWVCIAYAALIVFAPVVLFTSILPVYLVSLFFYIGYAFYVFTRALLHKRQGSEYAFLSSAVVLMLFFVINLAYFGFTTPFKEVISVGYILFLFLQSLILSSRFSYVLKTSAKKAEMGLKAKAEFLATISHEIRTPLNAVIGMTHLLLHNKPREDQKENLDAMLYSANNLLNIVNSILQYNQLEAISVKTELTEMSLRDLASKLIRSYEAGARQKELLLLLEVNENVPDIVNGDPEKLEQVLSILVNNGIKFTHKGSIQLIITQDKVEDQTSSIKFEVRDTGIGISAAEQKIIFEEFTQADSSLSRSYGGTGLGLAICKRILKSQRVEMHLKSEVGVGSKFWFLQDFEIVTVRSVTSPGQFEKSILQSKPLAKQTILLAEDNSLNVLVAQSILEDFGARVDVAFNGEEAVSMFEEGKHTVVLMDLSMPVMDGYTAAKTLRAKGVKAPIIALTANTPEDVGEQVDLHIFDDLVVKPFNPDALCRTLLRHLGIM